MSKQTRNSFPGQATYSVKEVLKIVHGDLCGHIEPATAAGNKYFFLLVDDYSRVMWVYFLKSKDEAFEAFKTFRAKVENGTQRNIKTLRTDRGGEFTSKLFNSYCEEAGIMRQLTTPYSPRQNGVVERKNRTVVEMARSFLKEKSLPSMFWAEAVCHSVYILNRLPTRAISGVTPYEAWSERKPNIGHVRVFGSLVHMKLPLVQVTKLSDRSKDVINLGKETGTKAYRLYDPVNGTDHVSRDVVFEEEKGWNWEQTETTEGQHQGMFTVLGLDTGTNRGEPEREGYYTPQAGCTNANEGDTETTQTSHDSMESSGTDTSSEPKNFRRLTEIYDATEEVELDDDELMLMGTTEPTSYNKAAAEHSWQQALRNEMEAVEKNDTWRLTKLHVGQKAIGLK